MRINAYGVAKYTNKIRINHDKTTIFRHRADDRPESTGESSGIEQTILPYRAGETFVFS